jgi:hypothetical protein
MLVVGVLLRSHFGPYAALCDSVLGAFGQALDPTVARDCTVARALTGAGSFGVAIGAVILVVGIVMLIAGARSSRPTQSHPL